MIFEYGGKIASCVKAKLGTDIVHASDRVGQQVAGAFQLGVLNVGDDGTAHFAVELAGQMGRGVPGLCRQPLQRQLVGGMGIDILAAKAYRGGAPDIALHIMDAGRIITHHLIADLRELFGGAARF